MDQAQVLARLERMERYRRTKLVLLALVGLGLVGLMGAKSIRPGSKVAIVDLKFLFEHSRQFEERTEDLRTSAQLLELEFKLRKEDIARQEAQLEELDADDPRRTTLQRQIAQAKGQLAVDAGLAKQKFVRQEAENYNESYEEVLDTVYAYMEEQGIELVIRFNNDPASPSEPESVMKRLNKPIVAHAEQVDITPIILRRLNREG